MEDLEELLDDHERLQEIMDDEGNLSRKQSARSTVKNFNCLMMNLGNPGNLDDLAAEQRSQSGEITIAPDEPVETDHETSQPGDFAEETGLMNESTNLEETNEISIPSVHKAKIPIARLRDALEYEEAEDKAGFRCAECAKCLKCKTSNKLYHYEKQENRL